jgi:hypothetical protein
VDSANSLPIISLNSSRVRFERSCRSLELFVLAFDVDNWVCFAASTLPSGSELIDLFLLVTGADTCEFEVCADG